MTPPKDTCAGYATASGALRVRLHLERMEVPR